MEILVRILNADKMDILALKKKFETFDRIKFKKIFYPQYNLTI